MSNMEVDKEFIKTLAKSLKISPQEILNFKQYPDKWVVVVQTKREVFKKELPINEVAV